MKSDDSSPHKIPSPYEVNKKVYFSIFIAIGIPLLIIFVLYRTGVNVSSHPLAIIESFLVGVLGSAFVSFLIEFANTRKETDNFEKQEKELFRELYDSIWIFCKFFPINCVTVQKLQPSVNGDKIETHEVHTWFEWAEILETLIETLSLSEDDLIGIYQMLINVATYPIDEINKILSAEEALRMSHHIDSETVVCLKQILKSLQILQDEVLSKHFSQIDNVLKAIFSDCGHIQILYNVNGPFSLSDIHRASK